MKLQATLFVVAAVGLFIPPTYAASENEDMATFFKGSKKFAYLSDSLARIGKTKLLREAGPFTFFVPENKAFDDLEYGRWVEVWNNKPLLSKNLMRGLVRGRFERSSFEEGKTLHTINGGTLKIEKRDGKLWIGKSRIKETDILCKNGVVHIMSKFVGKEADTKHINSRP